MARKIATFLRNLSDNDWTGDARLFRVSPPIQYTCWDAGERATRFTEYVVVSATCAMLTGDETYIFAADVNGRVQSWLELDGSFRGGMNHAAALAGAGYSVEAEAA